MPKKPLTQKERDRYAKLVEASKEAAFDEKLPKSLRSYYAGIALLYDKRLKNDAA